MSLTSQVLRKAFERKNISDDLGVSSSMYYKWRGGDTNPLDRTLKIMEMDNLDLVIDFLCDQAGGYFTKYEEGTCKNDLHANLSDMLKQITDVYQAASIAAADNKISFKEAESIKKEVLEASKSFTAFLAKAESGVWDK